MDLSEWLRGALKAYGLSQAELHRRSQLDESTISLLKKGTRNGEGATYRKLAQGFGLKLQTLHRAIEGGTFPEPDAVVPKTILDVLKRDPNLTPVQAEVIADLYRSYVTGGRAGR